MYVCGPTVYGDPHLGHARSSITFDIVYRYLSFLGYKVRYVRNITDVGHLEDEQNEIGEDKILKKARIEQLEPMEVAQHYTNVYRDAMRSLNIVTPSIEPNASGHIPEQIQTIQKIIENDLAYVVNDSVYFDVKEYVERYHYGELSGRVLDELQAASRNDLAGTSEKRFHADFALWKKAQPEHIMQWSSPWGKGFPGWHIECTAMSSKYLGIPFDIHGGGMDLKFPHHEAEICQSLGAFNKKPVNYWIHNNMITLNGQKMAKSKGNFITLNDLFIGNHSLLEKAFSPMVVRFYILQAHYGNTIDFSNSSLIAAESVLSKLEQSFRKIDSITIETKTKSHDSLQHEISTTIQSCHEAMDDDFNTEKLIATLFEISKIINRLTESSNERTTSQQNVDKIASTIQNFWIEILGMKEEVQASNKLDEVMEAVLELRQQAKVEKNYVYSDFIREKLKNIGIQIHDTKDEKAKYTIKD
jgi:cysteinyl-tRNA synthetase